MTAVSYAANADAAVARGARKGPTLVIGLAIGLLVDMALRAAYRDGLAQATAVGERFHAGRPCLDCARRGNGVAPAIPVDELVVVQGDELADARKGARAPERPGGPDHG